MKKRTLLWDYLLMCFPCITVNSGQGSMSKRRVKRSQPLHFKFQESKLYLARNGKKSCVSTAIWESVWWVGTNLPLSHLWDFTCLLDRNLQAAQWKRAVEEQKSTGCYHTGKIEPSTRTHCQLSSRKNGENNWIQRPKTGLGFILHKSARSQWRNAFDTSL